MRAPLKPARRGGPPGAAGAGPGANNDNSGIFSSHCQPVFRIRILMTNLFTVLWTQTDLFWIRLRLEKEKFRIQPDPGPTTIILNMFEHFKKITSL